MLIGYAALYVVVLIWRIGSASGTTDSSGSVTSIGQSIARAPSDSLTSFGDGIVNTSPLLAAPTDRLWPVPITPTHRAARPLSGGPPSLLPVPPPPQLASESTPGVNTLVRRLIDERAVYVGTPRPDTTIVDRGL